MTSKSADKALKSYRIIARVMTVHAYLERK